MWTSVPQMEAIFTRTRTSSGWREGTGTRVRTVPFGAGFSLTAAFIVADITRPSTRAVGSEDISTFYRMKFGCPISDEHEQVFLLAKFLVQSDIARVNSKDRRRREFPGCRDDDYVLRADAPQDRGAELQVPAPEDEALRADRTHDELRDGMPVEELQDPLFVQVRAYDSPADDRVDSQEGLREAEAPRDSVDPRAGPQEEERGRFPLEQLREVLQKLREHAFAGDLGDDLLPRCDEVRLDEALRGPVEADLPFRSEERRVGKEC